MDWCTWHAKPGFYFNQNWNIMLGAIWRSQVKTGKEEKTEERNVKTHFTDSYNSQNSKFQIKRKKKGTHAQYLNNKNENGGKQKVLGRMKCLTTTLHIQFTVKNCKVFKKNPLKRQENAIPRWQVLIRIEQRTLRTMKCQKPTPEIHITLKTETFKQKILHRILKCNTRISRQQRMPRQVKRQNPLLGDHITIKNGNLQTKLYTNEHVTRITRWELKLAENKEYPEKKNVRFPLLRTN